jgi:prophage regulatory protein
MTAVPTTKPQLPGRFLRKHEVCAITSLSPTQLNVRIQSGEFIKPTRLSPSSNILVWWEADVMAWIKKRLDARDGPEGKARGEWCKARARNAVAQRDKRRRAGGKR